MLCYDSEAHGKPKTPPIWQWSLLIRFSCSHSYKVSVSHMQRSSGEMKWRLTFDEFAFTLKPHVTKTASSDGTFAAAETRWCLYTNASLSKCWFVGRIKVWGKTHCVRQHTVLHVSNAASWQRRPGGDTALNTGSFEYIWIDFFW